MAKLKNIYLSNGLNEFKLNNHNDLLNVHRINVKNIPGYSNLSNDHRTLFDSFIINFYNTAELETRAMLVPVSVNFVLEEEYLGKRNTADDYYIPLGGKFTVLLNSGETKVISRWKDKAYKNLPCLSTEKLSYLRFEYKIGKSKSWQHVISNNEWY